MALMHGLYYVVYHQSNGNVVRDVIPISLDLKFLQLQED